MVGTTLVEIRAHVETLASEDGEYLVRCGRTGHRPVPVSELRFDDRTTAQDAARAAEQYRATLRRYDPQVPRYDLIVCQNGDPPRRTPESGECPCSAPSPEATSLRTLSTPVVNARAPETERRRLVEFCHSTAAAVFETLSEGGYGGVESAVMDAYFELAETVPDPDDLCLCLLESVAMELDDRLSPDEQAEVLAGAADRLSTAGATARPVPTALSTLEDRGLLGGYTRSPWSVELDEGVRSTVVGLSEYALTPRDGRLPVLPIVLELYRHRPDWRPASLRVASADDEWRLDLVLAREADPTGLASAPIEPTL